MLNLEVRRAEEFFLKKTSPVLKVIYKERFQIKQQRRERVLSNTRWKAFWRLSGEQYFVNFPLDHHVLSCCVSEPSVQTSASDLVTGLQQFASPP